MTGPLSYIGGKRRIAWKLARLIPPHVTYVEPFAGGAQVFFHKPRSLVEVLNDIDGEIVNFLRIVQRHPVELARHLQHQPASRTIFQRHQAQVSELLTDIERAARFFYLQKNNWGGKRMRRSFHYAVTKRSNYDPESFERRFVEASTRLSRVQIEAKPAVEILKRFDRPTTFFYCDPPYVGVDFYVNNLSDTDFETLARQLATIKGRFLLSINDCPKARSWFGAFRLREIALTYTAVKKPRLFSELLISNYDLPGPDDLNTPPICREGTDDGSTDTNVV